MGANFVLLAAGFVLLIVGQEGFLNPPLWMMLVEAGAPWVAVAVALRFPKRCAVLVDLAGTRIPLFGIWFFVALVPVNAFRYASLVRLLPDLELGSVVGAVLFAAVAIARRRAKERGPGLSVILLLLSLLYGCANLSQANCGLDDSPSTVYRTVVSKKSSYRAYSLDLEPWGANRALKSVTTRYKAIVPRETYYAVQEGGTVCVEQREGALGMAWYTARPCL
jgi:hypothetical protein